MSTDNKDAVLFDSLDDLFDADIDDLADLASFETPPKGAYIGMVTLVGKSINEKPAVEATFTVVETVELENADDTPVAAGSKFNLAFLVGNETGLGFLKAFLKPFAEHYGTGNLGALVRDHVQECQVAFTLKHRASKEDKEKVYPVVKNLTVA